MYPTSMVITGDTYAERVAAGTLSDRYIDPPYGPPGWSGGDGQQVFVSKTQPNLPDSSIWCELDGNGDPLNVWVEDGS